MTPTTPEGSAEQIAEQNGEYGTMARSAYLAGIMRDRGISQGWVSRETGLSKPTVMDAYHGRNVSTDTLVRIATKLGVPVSALDPDLANDLDGLIVR